MENKDYGYANWKSIKSFERLQLANIQFLLGTLVASPKHAAPIVSDHVDEIKNLLTINACGFITTDGQRGYTHSEANYAQKWYLQGFGHTNQVLDFFKYLNEPRDLHMYNWYTVTPTDSTNQNFYVHTSKQGNSLDWTKSEQNLTKYDVESRGQTKVKFATNANVPTSIKEIKSYHRYATEGMASPKVLANKTNFFVWATDYGSHDSRGRHYGDEFAHWVGETWVQIPRNRRLLAPRILAQNKKRR